MTDFELMYEEPRFDSPRSVSASGSSNSSSDHTYLPLPAFQPDLHFIEPFAGTNGLQPARQLGPDVNVVLLEELLKEQNVKKKRLARKAELARLSRKKKKSRLEQLEEEAARLQNELESVRKSRVLVDECTANSQQKLNENLLPAPTPTPAPKATENSDLAQQIQKVDVELKGLMTTLRTLVPFPVLPVAIPPETSSESSGSDQASNSDNAINALVGNLFSTLSKRVSIVMSCMKHVSSLAADATPLRFVEWVLGQSEKFYEDPHGLWNTIFRDEVGVSDSQMQQLLNLRTNCDVSAPSSPSSSSQTSFQSLSTATEDLMRTYTQMMDDSTRRLMRICETMNPTQVAKFLLWIQMYGAVCVRINV